MRKYYFIIISFFWISTNQAQIGINNPDPKASLDIVASDQVNPANNDGLLIPRLDQFPEINPTGAQNGMLIFLTTENSFYFWNASSDSWIPLINALVSVKKINDLSDGRSDNDGTEDGSSIYLGINAGANDEQTDNQNVGIGFEALQAILGGKHNIALGYKALKSNEAGYYNIAIGNSALESNTIKGNLIAIGDSALYHNGFGAMNSYESKGNIAIGHTSLFNNTTGNKNIAVGNSSMESNISGFNNTALGWGSMFKNTVGHRNVALGYVSLYSNIDGTRNTALGAYAMINNSSGNKNTAIGNGALYLNESGSENIAIGDGALALNTDRSNNVAVGDSALYFNGTQVAIAPHATENTAVGSKAGYNNTNGLSNSFFGYQSGFSNNAGYGNTFSGALSGFETTSGFFNTYAGTLASYSNATGYGNSVFGYRALHDQTTGNRNIALGYKAGEKLKSGSHNIIIGDSLMLDYADTSYLLNIGNLVTGNMADSLMIVEGSLQLKSNTNQAPDAGTIRWNRDSEDFEGYMGNEWKSLTFTGADWGWTQAPPSTENETWFDPNGNSGDKFGSIMDIFEDYVIFGYPYEGVSGNNNQGKASIYQRIDGNWVFQDTLFAPFGRSDDYFGMDVAISGDLAIVGAPGRNFSNSTITIPGKGMAYVFLQTGNDWILQDSITSDPSGWVDAEDFRYHFGIRVDISSDNAIITEGYNPAAGGFADEYAGYNSVYIFHKEISNWVLSDTLIATDYIYIDQSTAFSIDNLNSPFPGFLDSDYGYNIKIEGDHAFVSINLIVYDQDPDPEPPRPYSYLIKGRTYYFHREGSKWNFVQKLEAPQGHFANKFGFDIDLYQNNCLVGSPGQNSDGLINNGAAYLYELEEGLWSNPSEIIPHISESDDQFGHSVSILGNNILVGAPLHDTNGNVDYGKAYIFENGNEGWVQIGELVASDGETGNNFGFNVFLSVNKALVSAPNKAIYSNAGQGKIYVFEK